MRPAASAPALAPSSDGAKIPSNAPWGPAFVVAAGIVVAAFVVSGALDRQRESLSELASKPAAPPPAVTPVPAEAAPAQPERSPSLATVAGGRIVYTAPDGHLVVLTRDPTSGELEVERVYALVRDPDRHQGDRERLRHHGYYLDDTGVLHRRALEAASARYEAAVAKSARTYTDLDKAERAAADLANAGGAALLVPHIDAEASQLRKRTAAIGLARAGYLCAVQPLVALLRDHVGKNPGFFAELSELAGSLTGVELDPKTPAATIAALDQWLIANPLRDPFARVSR